MSTIDEKTKELIDLYFNSKIKDIKAKYNFIDYYIDEFQEMICIYLNEKLIEIERIIKNDK